MPDKPNIFCSFTFLTIIFESDQIQMLIDDPLNDFAPIPIPEPKQSLVILLKPLKRCLVEVRPLSFTLAEW